MKDVGDNVIPDQFNVAGSGSDAASIIFDFDIVTDSSSDDNDAVNFIEIEAEIHEQTDSISLPDVNVAVKPKPKPKLTKSKSLPNLKIVGESVPAFTMDVSSETHVLNPPIVLDLASSSSDERSDYRGRTRSRITFSRKHNRGHHRIAEHFPNSFRTR